MSCYENSLFICIAETELSLRISKKITNRKFFSYAEVAEICIISSADTSTTTTETIIKSLLTDNIVHKENEILITPPSRRSWSSIDDEVTIETENS